MVTYRYIDNFESAESLKPTPAWVVIHESWNPQLSAWLENLFSAVLIAYVT